MNPAHKQWIDNASYKDMLERQRFAPVGDPIFQDNDTWEYWCKSMNEKAESVDTVAISKEIGWEI